jgi:putative oxidoreductase
MASLLGFIDRLLAPLGRILQSPLLLLLRLFFGISFIFTGLGKLNNMAPFIDLLNSQNIPNAHFFAWAVALTELIGGFLLATGLFSRLAALALAIVMAVAYGTVHVNSLYALTTDPGMFTKEAPFNYLLTALLVLAFGPGCLSLDALFGCKSSKEKT